MRQTRKPQLALGEARIEDIKLDHKSRDDIPAVLLGLQHLYSHEETREKLFSLLEEHILPGTNRNVGRPGMELWRILVMGVLKQGLGCDFDRLHELVNQHRTVREFLGHGAFSQDDTYEFSDDHRQCVSVDPRASVKDWAVSGGERPRGRKKKAWRAVARAL